MNRKYILLWVISLSFLFMSCDTDRVGEHEYVDLGLPSGLKWATCNIGASLPEEYGDYFAWGETVPKQSYTEENNITWGKSVDNIVGDEQHDAARANWGESWRMPTAGELQELVDNCQWEWAEQNGINGYRVTGKNGKTLFFPAAGFRGRLSLHFAGDEALYWSSCPTDKSLSRQNDEPLRWAPILESDTTQIACGLYIRKNSHRVELCERSSGRSIRAVTE